jgi:septal ring factor EnvC (AmiA/AmiB activator)
MMLGELTAEGWGVVIAAFSAMLVAFVGAIGTLLYRMKVENNKTMLAMKQLELQEKKVDKTKTARELEDAIDRLTTEHKSDREQIHSQANLLNTLTLKQAVTEERLKYCEEDRAELRTVLEGSGIHFPARLPKPGG